MMYPSGIAGRVVLLSMIAQLPAFAAEHVPPETAMTVEVPMRALTRGPKSHWFGYYDKYQFDPGNRYALCMQVDFENRAPTPEDEIVLGMIDLEDNDKWIPFAASTAWCWQQGCMLQWLPGSDSEVIYNVRKDGRYMAVIQDVVTGEKRMLPRPVYTVSADGKTAVGLNFARVGQTRPGYGYNGIADAGAEQLHPADDGIYSLDLVTGESSLILTLEQIASFRTDDTMEKGKHWFNHLLFNTDGTRFIFLHRWHRESGKGWYTRGFTAQPDGANLFCFNDHGMVSHFIWRDPKHILAWSQEPDTGNRFHLYEDMTDTKNVIGEALLQQDGHCTYSPCGQWILTDTYPDRERMQTLMLYRPADNALVPLGRFYQAPTDDIQLRCDLHPRWSRDGAFICIDSKWSGQRQLYLLDVRDIIAS
ncbi:MAG TPA: hypothetical protein ENN29_05540 [Candidatus Hydrogenedentes bacterium]|nr:hypothetical protein [Candidatus Hydrogenedentota bacterium]